MSEVIKINNTYKIDIEGRADGLVELTDDLLEDARSSINSNKALSVPIGKLSTLGAVVSTLIPSLNKVTQTTTFATNGLFRIANAAAGDNLKLAKNGNAWGAMKTAEGGSKMVQLAEAGPLTATTQSVAAFNPATMMMAVALYSIEKDIAEIAETQKEILTFLEVENESQIEADVESLMEIITNYKYNWDNKLSVASSHKLVLDIQNRARKNMIAFQKKVTDIVSSKQFVVAQSKVNSILSDLEKKFKYYRLSLYTYSLGALMEIMLSGNFKEEYIAKVKEEIKNLSDTYREQFKNGSLYLEGICKVGLDTNVVKGIGIAGKTVGKIIGSIPLVKEGQVDEYLKNKGAQLHKNAIEMETKAIKEFAAACNPGTKVFVDKMEDMIQIYNHTAQICFDNENIYLIA